VILSLRRGRQSGPQIARALGMPKATVARVLKRAGLHRLRLVRIPANLNACSGHSERLIGAERRSSDSCLYLRA